METNAEFSAITTEYHEKTKGPVATVATMPEHFAQVDFLRGEHLQPRIRSIFAAILANERTICQYEITDLDIHIDVGAQNPVRLELHCKLGT